MHTILNILRFVDRDVWTRIGGSFERSQLWLAMYHGCEILKAADAEAQALKDNVNGTGKDVSEDTEGDGHYQTEEDVSPYVVISHQEKFQWACHLLRWMDDNEEFHTYKKAGQVLRRHRPDVEETDESFLRKTISEAQRKEMTQALGEKYAENWFKQADVEGSEQFERYGAELVELIAEERSSHGNDTDLDWNWSAFADDLSERLQKPLERQLDAIPEKYGYTTPWVISIVAKLTLLQRACS